MVTWTAVGTANSINGTDNTITFANLPVALGPNAGIGYYTLGTVDQATSPVGAAQTWYVFQDGDWSDPNTWTTDASTAPQWKNPGNETPSAADDIIIRSGRTVTIQDGTDNRES